MTREMNKPDYEQWKVESGKLKVLKQRVLNPDIKEFFERCCNMERLK